MTIDPSSTPSPPAPTGPLTPDQRRIVASVIGMYREGWFPMWDEDDDEVRWVQPKERGILPIGTQFTVTRSLRSRVRSGKFVITTDRAFGRVIRECGVPAPGREQTWLHPSIVHAFDLLHAAGHAHSVEAWCARPDVSPTGQPAPPADGKDRVTTDLDRTHTLVGGLYGLALGRVFSGESMFSRPQLGGTDASKVCLVHLVNHLRRRGFVLLDAQLSNEHLAQFGLTEIPRADYLAALHEHGGHDVPWLPFAP